MQILCNDKKVPLIFLAAEQDSSTLQRKLSCRLEKVNQITYIFPDEICTAFCFGESMLDKRASRWVNDDWGDNDDGNDDDDDDGGDDDDGENDDDFVLNRRASQSRILQQGCAA